MLKKHFFHSCLYTDRIDKRQFERLFDISTKMQSIEAKGEKVFPGYFNFMGDQWAALYKVKPEINPEASGRAAIHRPLMQKIMASDEYQKLREQTILDDFAAAIGTLSLSESIIKYIEEQQKNDEQLKQLREQQKKIQWKIKKNQQAMLKCELQGKQPSSQQQQKAQNLESQLQQVQQQMAQQLAEGIDVSQILIQAAQEAQETRKGIEDLLSGSKPGSGPAEMRKIPLKQQLELAEILKHDKTVKKVAEWAGRFKAIARKKQKSKHIFALEYQGIAQGNDTELLLPTELAMLKNPSTKLDFYRRFTERQTLQYSPQGKESAGKGPIVLCLDQSGSMANLKEQAAGFALAIAMIARLQHRDFAYIPFSSIVEEPLIFQKGKIPVDGILAIATKFLNGGTNFEKPLKEAIKIIESRDRFKNADIIFVTDGEANIGDRFLREYNQKKKKLSFQCMGCVLGEFPNHDTMEKFTDEWFLAVDLLAAAEESSIFEI